MDAGAPGYRLGLLLLALWFPLAGTDAQQGLGGIQKGFKAAEFFGPPHETQMQSLLQAEQVQPYSTKLFLLAGLTLRTFRETGEPELVITAPQCLYDLDAKSASSPGPLRATTADGKFSLEGEGFSLWQTNSSLMISNRVVTVLDPSLLNPKDATTREPARKSGTPGIEIRADHFEYSGQTALGVYERNVRVTGSNDMSLASDRVTFELPFRERQLKTLRAEGNVVVDRAEVHATGQTAVYSAETGLIRLTGDPAWHYGQREGRGDLLLIDRTNKVFRSEGNSWVKMPAQGLSLSSFLASSNATPGAVAPATNHFVEVSSAYHEFRTNRAVFGENVVVTERIGDQPRGTLTCGLLNATYARSNQLEMLVAQTNVVLKDGTNLLSGGQAVLNGTNGLLEVSDHPAWLSGSRSGKGDVIRVDTRASALQVQGHASMRLPAQEFARAANPRGVASAVKLDAMANTDWAEIFSEEYTLQPRRVEFRGGVYATHPQMNWACERLTAELPDSGGQLESLVAEHQVVFDLIDEQGQKVHGRGDKVVYTYRVTPTATNDLLELTGEPAVLESARGTNLNKIIILDRVHHQLITPGDYRITGALKGAGTNALVLPNTKLTK